METTISLLTRDGAVYIAFAPALDASQYARLLDIAKRAEGETQLKEAVAMWARSEGLRYSFDEMRPVSRT